MHSRLIFDPTARPHRKSRLRAACVLISLVGFTACSSSTSAPSDSSGNASTGGAAAVLSEQIRAGIAGIRSAHVELIFDMLPGGVTLTGEAQFTSGTLAAADLLDKANSRDTLRLIYADGQVFARLPAALNQSGKPWLRVGAHPSNPVLAGFGSPSSVRDTLSLSTVMAEIGAAESVKPDGQFNVGNSENRRYRLAVELAKLPKALRDFGSLTAPGQQSIQETIAIDTLGRPTAVSIELRQARLGILYNHFNEPVHISAPPSSQIAPA